MRKVAVSALLCASLLATLTPLGASDNEQQALKIFTEAREHAMLRAPGTRGFHLHATFHASPGIELLAVGQQGVMTGDGVYDEIWLDPHTWRREVKLASFHAVEVESPDGRKYQASDEYVPVRVLMLLDSLYNPIPKYLVSAELGGKAARGWKLDTISATGGEYLRLHKAKDGMKSSLTETFYLLPNGVFVLHNDRGLVTSWEQPQLFSGKEAPTRLRVLAEPDRELVTADLTIEPAETAQEASFTLPGSVAQPGDTLRPLHGFEVRLPNLSDSFVGPARTSSDPMFGMTFPYSFHSVLDRHGRYREVELIHLPSWDDMMQHNRTGMLDEKRKAAVIEMQRDFLQHRRGVKNPAATIDGSPCQVLLETGVYI